ncbi:hypothetical protein ACFQ9V_08080 [Leifsonia sp. NPDC056665]|uniref:hypothetical protein n=1 Tax=Leifsonia sp. NPDC056665 TaxID=3345901 RepID=UPI00368D9477
MNLRDVAADLYGVEPAEFVAARASAAAGADRELAKSIKALRKPTASAAAVNALTRRDPELVDRILQLGDRMRDAFAARDRDAIRDLTRERQRLLQRALRDLGTSAAVGREVEETLQAAVVDPVAAAAVRSGMLLRALESTGVESVDVADAVALPLDEESLAAAVERSAEPLAAPGPAKARKAAPPQDDGEHAPDTGTESASERRERERTIRAAERALERARADAESLDDELDAEVERRSDLQAERDAIERRLQRTEAELSESKAAERALRRRIPELQRAVRDAERALDDARGD